MTVSVIIPCIACHFPYLFPLLQQLEMQTSLPEEVVISLSETEHLSTEEIGMLEHHPWPFQLKLIQHKKKKSAGENRNSAAEAASSTVLVCQDADDLPHPQRIECIRSLFETFQIDFLLHSYTFDPKTWISYDISTVPVQQFFHYKQMLNFCLKYHISITYGSVCYLRKLAQTVSWPETQEVGEDLVFIQRLFSAFNKGTLTPASLLLYRIQLSAQKTVH